MQTGILDDVPRQGRYQLFSLNAGADLASLRQVLGDLDGDSVVVGLGQAWLDAAGVTVDGMQYAPVFAGKGIATPALPAAVCLWFRGDDLGDIIQQSLAIEEQLVADLTLIEQIDVFRYREGRDLTGYVDGTENPEGERARTVASTADGGSFLALQRWRHDLHQFHQLSQPEQDDVMGRRLADNEEFDEAPAAAHVKRAAMESFEPEAFVLRRSMPFTDAAGEGLMFSAFAGSFVPFTMIFERMLGNEDGIVDNLFTFSQCEFTSFFWCPPSDDNGLRIP